jgi:histidine triad (HIT) family protein
MACVFCRIVEGELAAEVLLRDERTLAVLDAQPLVEGHTLVIPRAHVARIEDLEPDDARTLFAAVTRLAAVVRVATGAAGTTIGINNGPATGQTIPHVHVHLVPRRPDDGGGSIHSIVRVPTRRSTAEIAAEIRRRWPAP